MATGSRVPAERHRTEMESARRQTWIVLLLQLLVAIPVLGFGVLLGRAFAVLVSMLLYFFSILAVQFLGIQHSIKVVRLQNRAQREDPNSPGPLGPWPILGPLIATLFWAIILGAFAYIRSFWNDQVSEWSIIEGLNYSVQTITTVGYGNWAPTSMAFNDSRLICMKEFSIGLMLVGASLFTSIIGMFANWLGSL